MADGNSKKKRRDHHAGRARGSVIKTGHSGGGRVRLSVIDKALITPYLDQKGAQMRQRSLREKPGR